ncbi:hypothetical protein AB0M46_06010 [Dactylosporangium sp. NPDC051485]|uniref:hypothetical protein n=1 Tax=Dactylosporangium sp. NPDC051485 TaxID=3154846 RepID=UPI0034328F38
MKSGALVGWLGNLDATELTEILRRRPDALSSPAPADLDDLAARLSDRAAVAGVLETLPLPALQVLEALGDGPVPPDRLAAELGRAPGDPEVEAVLQVLTQRALVWSGRDGLMPIFPYASDTGGSFEPVPPAPRLIPADRLRIMRTTTERPVLQLVNWWSGPPLRQVVVRVLHNLPPDTAAAGDSLAPLVHWTAPLTTGGLPDLSEKVNQVLTDASELGICAEPQPGYFAIGPVGRALADGRPLVPAQRLRVRPVGSVVVSEDPDLLDEVAAALELERFAPTVAGSSEPPAETIAALRAAGYVPEAEAGRVTLRRRANPAELARRLAVPLQRNASPLEQIRRRAPRLTPAQAQLLAEAVERGTPVWIRYVDAGGRASERVIEHAALAGPTIEAFCRLRRDDRAFALERIVAAAAVQED